jgi:tartrate dehydratase alpha subunit/fumarate hydratase class I-like protein
MNDAPQHLPYLPLDTVNKTQPLSANAIHIGIGIGGLSKTFFLMMYHNMMIMYLDLSRSI